ncbi:rho GTPase-activating protein 12-like isoform X2 [Penaeus japonicus]|nr:rho GTPase-activating protein 12-like isoform X2 [Penaeus japonicus]
MTEGSMKGVETEEFVEATHDYSYQRDDRTFSMTKGEIFLLIKRASPDWWQVIRHGEQRPFFAPKQYLQLTLVSYEQMKQVSRQGCLQQKSKHQVKEEESGGQSHGMPQTSNDNIPSPPFTEIPSSTTPNASQSYMTKIELSRVTKERNDPYPSRPGGLSSFKSESPIVPPKGLPYRSGSNELSSPTAYSRGFIQGGHDSSSSHTSKSSLNDSSRCSMESLTQLHARKQAMKAASHDELMSGERSRSVLDVSQPKAASSEELDGRYSGRDYYFRSNQLSYRHRSNSVDLKFFHKDLSFTEMKQGSLDKSRKPRISKDPGNRRRSWAVEERLPEHFRPFKKAETQDTAIILDVPPKLPPKQRKHKHDPFGSSSENLGKLEGPIDIKLQEVKKAKPALPLTGPNVKRLGQDYDRSSKSSDTAALFENQRKASLRRQDGMDAKEPPVALPRKLIPPQVLSTDSKTEEHGNRQGLKAVMPSVSESPAKDSISNKVKSDYNDLILNREQSAQEVRSQAVYPSDLREGSSFRPESAQRPGRVDSFRKAREAPRSPNKATGTPEMSRKVLPSGTPDSVRKSYSLERGSPKPDFGKEDEKENEAMRIPPRELHTPDSARGIKTAMQMPPSPRTPPQRLVFDDWGEYTDEVTRRPYYYNTRTREKRWKPPRKGIHSVAAPEVPPHARQENRGGSLGRGQTRSPPIDYPPSPNLSHKLRAYATLPESGSGSYHGFGHSSTLTHSTSSSLHAHHYPLATSHTLPILSQSSRNIPLPLVPPSSAKPILPNTPTTPTTPDVPENLALLDTLYKLSPPKGWSRKYDSFMQRVYFCNRVTGERVRRSMFISHDEEDSILEDKPLTSESGEASARAFGTEDDTPGQGARRFFPPSPRCLSPDNGSGTHSDREESTFSDDTEGSTSTLPCLGIGSDHYKELKRSLDSEKWLATNNDDGKIYYYEESGSKSQWKLPELDSFDEFGTLDGHQTSTLESQRVSLVTENLAELSKHIVKEGFLQRTFLLKEGKKVRKNWTSSYARYIVSSFNSGSQGLIHFSKTKDDDKKAEVFDFIPPCFLDLSNDKKTSRQQVIALRNGHDTEVLLQFEDRDIENEWLKVLVDHDGMQKNMTSVAEKEEKKGKKGSEKMKRAASIEQLAPDSKGITDKLLNFIKRRPLKETLEKKGIYKEAVFGSTLSELHQQDKTTIPIFVLQCINHIEKSVENLRSDGLYRISGNAAQIQKIRYEVAQRNYTILSREKEVHNLSGALKLFFRELKEPLIPFANYQDFIQATGSEYRKKNQQVEKLTKAVRQLPVENYDTLKVLLQHLLRVSEYESENRMSISNLAIVFGPCLLWPKITNAQDLMTDVMLHNRVIEGLLLDYHKIFPSKR